jgi:hypothetical protein
MVCVLLFLFFWTEPKARQLCLCRRKNRIESNRIGMARCTHVHDTTQRLPEGGHSFRFSLGSMLLFLDFWIQNNPNPTNDMWQFSRLGSSRLVVLRMNGLLRYRNQLVLEIQKRTNERTSFFSSRVRAAISICSLHTFHASMKKYGTTSYALIYL